MSIKNKFPMIPKTSDQFSKSTAIVFSQIEANTSINAAHIKCMNALIAGYQSYVRETFKNSDAYHESNKRRNAVSFTMAYDHFKSLAELNTTRNIDYIQGVLNTLLEHKYTYNHSSPGHPDFGTEQFLYNYRVLGNKIEFTIPSSTREAIMYSEGAATLSTTLLNSMLGGHKYAQLLYPALVMDKQYHPNSKNLYTVTMTDEQLRNALKIEYENVKGKRHYKLPQPGRLSAKAIRPAISKINEVKLGIKVLDFTNKKWEGVRYWQFNVEEAIDPAINKFLEKYTHEITELKVRLRQFKLSPKSYADFLGRLTNEEELFYLTYVLGLVDNYKRKLTNKAGYLVKCYQSNREEFEANNLLEIMKAEHEERVEAFAKREREKLSLEYKTKKLSILKGLADKPLDDMGVSTTQIRERFGTELSEYLAKSESKAEQELSKVIQTQFYSDEVQIALYEYICAVHGEMDEEEINMHLSGIIVHSTSKSVPQTDD